jgi:hypothetical protein
MKLVHNLQHYVPLPNPTSIYKVHASHINTDITPALEIAMLTFYDLRELPENAGDAQRETQAIKSQPGSVGATGRNRRLAEPDDKLQYREGPIEAKGDGCTGSVIEEKEAG